MSHNSDKIWVSELNARPDIRGAFPRTKIHFYDTTLRDGEEQTVGVVLSRLSRSSPSPASWTS